MVASVLATAASAFAKAFFDSRTARAERDTADSAHERAAIAENARETQSIVTEIADARANLAYDDNDDGDALARRLRERAAAGRASAGGA